MGNSAGQFGSGSQVSPLRYGQPGSGGSPGNFSQTPTYNNAQNYFTNRAQMMPQFGGRFGGPFGKTGNYWTGTPPVTPQLPPGGGGAGSGGSMAPRGDPGSVFGKGPG